MSLFVVLVYLIGFILPVLVIISCWLGVRAYKRWTSRVIELEAEVDKARNSFFLIVKILAGRGYGRYTAKDKEHTLEHTFEYFAINKDDCVIRFWASDFSDKERSDEHKTE